MPGKARAVIGSLVDSALDANADDSGADLFDDIGEAGLLGSINTHSLGLRRDNGAERSGRQ